MHIHNTLAMLINYQMWLLVRGLSDRKPNIDPPGPSLSISLNLTLHELELLSQST